MMKETGAALDELDGFSGLDATHVIVVSLLWSAFFPVLVLSTKCMVLISTIMFLTNLFVAYSPSLHNDFLLYFYKASYK